MECRGISQVTQAEHIAGKVTYKDGYHTDRSFIRFITGLYQIRAVKVCTQTKSFCPESEDLYGCFKNGMDTTSVMSLVK